jgi:hypothetical protein
MGVAYDCFWYWKHEFNGQTDPYSDHTNCTAHSGNVVNNNASTSHVPWSTHSLGGEEEVLAHQNFVDDHDEGDFFPSWEWPSDNAFL